RGEIPAGKGHEEVSPLSPLAPASAKVFGTGLPGCPGLGPGRLTLVSTRPQPFLSDALGLARGDSRWFLRGQPCRNQRERPRDKPGASQKKPKEPPPVETNVSDPGPSPGHPGNPPCRTLLPKR